VDKRPGQGGTLTRKLTAWHYGVLDLTITTLGKRGPCGSAHHGLEKATGAQDLAGDEEGRWRTLIHDGKEFGAWKRGEKGGFGSGGERRCSWALYIGGGGEPSGRAGETTAVDEWSFKASVTESQDDGAASIQCGRGEG
jgi:hypothetical protein